MLVATPKIQLFATFPPNNFPRDSVVLRLPVAQPTSTYWQLGLDEAFLLGHGTVVLNIAN